MRPKVVDPLPSAQPQMEIGGLFKSRLPEAAEAAEDDILIRQIARGNPEAFDTLYRRLSSRLNRIAWLVCRNKGDSADIVQDVFVTLWEKAAMFDSRRGRVFSWLAQITRFRAIDLLRTRRRQIELLSTFGAESETLSPTDGAVFTERPAEAHESHQAVSCAVAALPDKMKRALHLVYFERLTHFQAADQLREPVGTVKSRIRRALRVLGTKGTLAREKEFQPARPLRSRVRR